MSFIREWPTCPPSSALDAGVCSQKPGPTIRHAWLLNAACFCKSVQPSKQTCQGARRRTICLFSPRQNNCSRPGRPSLGAQGGCRGRHASAGGFRHANRRRHHLSWLAQRRMRTSPRGTWSAARAAKSYSPILDHMAFTRAAPPICGSWPMC